MKSWAHFTAKVIYNIVQVVFLASVAYMIWFIMTQRAPLIEPEPVHIMSDWTYLDQITGPKRITTPVRIDRRGRDAFVFESTLPTTIPDGSVVAFLSKADLTVEIDGKVVKDWRRAEAPIIGGPAKNSYFIIPVSIFDAGRVIRITMGRDGFSGKMFNVFVGDKYEVVRYLEDKSGLVQFVISLILMAVSFSIFIGGIVFGAIYKSKFKLTMIALGIFAASAWMVMDSFVFQFLFRTQFIDGLMSYMTTLCLIFPFLGYFDAIQEYRYQKAYLCIGIVEFISLIVFTTFHITRVLNFSVTLLPVDAILGAGIVACLVITIIDFRRGFAKSYRYVAYGFLALMVLAIIEIILINTVIERVEGGMIITGLFILLAFAVVQQISEIRQVHLERNRANEEGEAKTRFLASMSHEIRTPINSILGMNEMILKESSDPNIINYAKIISDSGTLLLSLINDVLDFSKIGSDMEEIVCVNYDPDKMFKVISEMLRTQASRKNLTVKIGKPRNLPKWLYGDDKKITQIVINLATNAVKYTDEGSVTLTGECFEEDDRYILCFYVSDTGIGIKQEDLDGIFNPFQRTDLRKNQNIQGTGLGLSIVKGLVEKMGGEIQVESVYGRGSTFSVRIPQKKVDEADVVEKYNSGNAIEDDMLEGVDEHYTAPGAHILEVDDNTSNQIVVREFLKKTGITIDMASEGKEAVRLCKMNSYDLILMDHMMPGMDGIEAMHTIRDDKDGLNTKTPIIILTANAIRGNKAKYEEEGFDNYLSKPVESSRLLKMVRKYLPEDKVQSAGGSTDQKGQASTDGSSYDVSSLIDMQALCARFDNKIETVNLILQEVVKEGERKIPLIRSLAESGDMKGYAIEAHGVKGTMQSACIMSLSAIAKSHELAAKEGNVDFVNKNFESFLAEYREVLDFIVNYLESIGEQQ